MIDLPIATERLTIRRLTPRDLDTFLEFMLDEDSTRYLAFEPEQTTAEGAKGLFEYVLQAYDTPEPVHACAIADKATDEYLGSCGFSPYEEGVVECYYSVNAPHRGKGIAAEATTALVTVLSATVEVRAYCHPDNAAAHKVALRAGLEHAGSARNANSGLEGELFVSRP